MSNDLADAIDAFADEHVGADSSPREDAAAGDATTAGGFAGTGFSLEELAKPGSRFADIAAELVVARDERLAKAERARLSAVAEAAVEAGSVGFTDPAVLAGLRLAAEDARRASESTFRRHRERDLVERYGDEMGRSMAAREVADHAGASWFDDGDALLDHPAYRAHEAATAEAARARATAQDMSRGYGYADELADAEDFITAVLEAAR